MWPKRPRKTCTHRTLTFRHWYDLGDLPIDYLLETGIKRQVALSRIIPTQPDVSLRGVAYYLGKQRHTRPGGLTPRGLRFAGDPAVYLIDGHHRLVASRLRGRQRMWLELVDLPPMAELLSYTPQKTP